MSYISSNPQAYAGRSVGTGQCVAFVQAAAGAPHTGSWKPGATVRGADIKPGTVIATFISGKYPSMAHGNHAAIYISQDAKGIWVWDQWVSHRKTGTVVQPVHKHYLRFKDPASHDRSNNGNAFSVVE